MHDAWLGPVFGSGPIKKFGGMEQHDWLRIGFNVLYS